MISRRMCMGLIIRGRGRCWGLSIGGWRRVLMIRWRLFWSGSLDTEELWRIVSLYLCYKASCVSCCVYVRRAYGTARILHRYRENFSLRRSQKKASRHPGIE